MKTINILFIGNSFSEDLAMYVPELGREKHIKINTHILGYGGCSIDKHIELINSDSKSYVYSSYDFRNHRWDRKYNIAFSEVINSFKWDYICIQQASFLASQSESFKNLDALIDIVKYRIDASKVKFIWQMTWEYPSYYKHEDFSKIYNNNSLDMYNDIVKNVKDFIINNPNISLIIPSAIAIRYLKEYKPEQEIYRDNLHLSYHIGRYLLSLLFIKIMFNYELDSFVTVPFSIPLVDKNKCIEIVNKASAFKI